MPEEAPEARMGPGKSTIPAELETFFAIAERWALSTDEQIALLGSPGRSTFFKWRKDGGTLAVDTRERISHMLGIWKSLRILFTQDDRGEAWIREKNRYFDGASALDVMLENMSGIVRVRRYSMPSVGLENAPLVRWSGEAFRLIPSRFPPVDVYEGLIAHDRKPEVVAVEDITNPRLRSLIRLQGVAPGGSSADPKLQNWNLAPFAYGNPDGTVFFGEDRPCLEVAAERQTALAVSVARRTSFMEATMEAPIGLDMRMLCTPVSGRFWDLRDLEPPPAAFDEARRREIGATMPQGAQGILYRPAERPAGTCLAITTGEVLRRSEQTAHFRYVWDGQRISVLYAFDKKGTPIEAHSLTGRDDVLTAA